jgi:hypothetical protein
MSSEQQSGAAMSDEERARAVREQLKTIHGFDVAYEMMVSLISFGYQKLGLTGDTLELRDLGDARLAIDLLKALLDVVERDAGQTQTRDLRSTLAQMQIGYAEAVHLAGGTHVPAPRQEAGSAQKASDEAVDEPGARAEAAAVAEPPAAAEQAAETPAEPAAAKPAEEAATPPKRRAAAKKPAAPKSAAQKPAAKKPPVKKPAAGKPAAKRAPKKPGGATPTSG